MVDIFPPIWIKPQEDEKDVMVFGKNPEHIKDDSESGVSRFGGFWRKPSYIHAYLRSTKILFHEGFKSGTLDDIGLPLFYLQRHTTELLLKRLLIWIFDIDELNIELGEPAKDIPTKKHTKNFKREHSLSLLLKDLKELSGFYKYDSVPESLENLVNILTKTEKTETWSRYYSSGKENNTITHVDEEHVVPIKEIQEALESSISECLINGYYDEQAYEQAYYDEWLTKFERREMQPNKYRRPNWSRK